MDNSVNDRLVEIEKGISKIETKLEEHDKLLQKQQEKNDAQTELNALIKLQIETSKEQSKTLQKFESTLVKVNENLTNLNTNQQQLGERVDNIEDTLKEQTVDKTKIIISILKYVGGTLSTLAIAYILYKLGISSIHK